MNRLPSNSSADLQPPSILFVSEDWFARSLFRAAADECGAFSEASEADDGYTALAELWQFVEDHNVPDILLIDLAANGPAAGRLFVDVRTSAEIRGIFIATISPATIETSGVLRHADFASECTVLSEDFAACLGAIARAATVRRMLA